MGVRLVHCISRRFWYVKFNLDKMAACTTRRTGLLADDHFTITVVAVDSSPPPLRHHHVKPRTGKGRSIDTKYAHISIDCELASCLNDGSKLPVDKNQTVLYSQ